MKIKKRSLWAVIALIAGIAAGSPVHAADKVIRIAHQKLSTEKVRN